MVAFGDLHFNTASLDPDTLVFAANDFIELILDLGVELRIERRGARTRISDQHSANRCIGLARVVIISLGEVLNNVGILHLLQVSDNEILFYN